MTSLCMVFIMHSCSTVLVCVCVRARARVCVCVCGAFMIEILICPRISPYAP
jgi:hypothetical protein